MQLSCIIELKERKPEKHSFPGIIKSKEATIIIEQKRVQ